MGRFQRLSMHDGKRSYIRLLDGQTLELTIQPRLVAEELLNIIANHVALKDSDRQYFGVAYVDDLDQYHWLPKEKRILEFDIPRKPHQSQTVLILHHSIKFFVDSVFSLCYPSAVELYFLETARRLVKGLLEFTEMEYYKIASNFLQIYCGDYVSEEKAQAAFSELLPIPNMLLHAYDVTLDNVEKNVINSYKNLCGTTKGVAILNFLQTAERSPTHGSHFYQVRDKSGQCWTVGINNKGIFQYDPTDISKAKKVFNWSLLDNLYYRDRKFSIEVRNTRVIQSSGNANSILDSTGCLDSDDELARAVRDPTTQVSVSRRSLTSSTVQIHTFYCDSNFLCKTIWSTAISLHQFYLDQRTSGDAKRVRSFESGLDFKDLSKKFYRLLNASPGNCVSPSVISLTSSLPKVSISSLSLPSLRSSLEEEKTEEDVEKELKLHKQLISKKCELEDKLLLKLEELREICLKEGQITGKIPRDIQKTLLPDEKEPKVQRRIGTAFCFSEDIIKRSANSNDKISMLEADIELYRKIVTAAERLACDKTTNKSVRKKRQKDWLAAVQKLRGLETGLKQLRLSSSKPEVNASAHDDSGKKGDFEKNFSNHQAESAALSSRSDTNLLVTKSCPATPRGSFPDLFTPIDSTDEEGTKTSRDCPQRSTSTLTCPNSFPAQHSAYITDIKTDAVDIGLLSASQQPSGSKHLNLTSLGHFRQTRHFFAHYDYIHDESSNRNIENHQIPVYENIGYKSPASYKSSYRETNFPTLNDQSNPRTRIQLTTSDYDFTEPESAMRTNKTHELRHSYHSAIRGPNETVDYGAKPNCLEQQGRQYHGTSIRKGVNHREVMYPIDELSPTTCQCLSMKLANSSFNKYSESSPPVTNTTLNDERTLRYALDGFATASLDRRAMKDKQTSTNSLANYQVKCPQKPSVGKRADFIREKSNSQLAVKQSSASAPRFTTTFPVTTPNNVKKSKSFVQANLRRYQQCSPLRQHNDLEHSSISSPLEEIQITQSSPNLRPPLPFYPDAVRDKVLNNTSRTEAVLRRREKNATIV